MSRKNKATIAALSVDLSNDKNIISFHYIVKHTKVNSSNSPFKEAKLLNMTDSGLQTLPQTTQLASC